MMRWIGVVCLSLCIALSGFAEEPLSDPKQEARAQELMRELRCVACENEPISQSAAEIAGDMRVKVRELVAEGKSDAEVRAWFKSRYGEFVLFRPSGKGISGLFLWGAPFVLLLIGGAIALTASRRKDTQPVEAIDPEDI